MTRSVGGIATEALAIVDQVSQDLADRQLTHEVASVSGLRL